MVRFPRRQTEQLSPTQEMMLTAAGRPMGERKGMCHDRLDALYGNDVLQLKTVKVELMGPG